MPPSPRDIPATPAIRWLRSHHVDAPLFSYAYEEHGGTRAAAAALGIGEHACIKTLVMETSGQKPFVILMHGDRGVSLKQLARVLGVKSVTPCIPAAAQRHTGYQVGGTSPFGLRKPLPVYVERTILSLPELWINAGRRGLLCKIPSDVLSGPLGAVPVDAATGHP